MLLNRLSTATLGKWNPAAGFGSAAARTHVRFPGSRAVLERFYQVVHGGPAGTIRMLLYIMKRNVSYRALTVGR